MRLLREGVSLDMATDAITYIGCDRECFCKHLAGRIQSNKICNLFKVHEVLPQLISHLMENDLSLREPS